MDSFVISMELRWADLDPNFHLRNAVYYDFGASARVAFLHQHGITIQYMNQHSFGPVIFREECVFKKEIRYPDIIRIDMKLQKARSDYARWTIRHSIYKNAGLLCAILTVDGAWIDVVKRKLATPPTEVNKTFDSMPREKDFEWI